MIAAETLADGAMDIAVSIDKDIPSRITGENRIFIRAVIARAITAAVAAEREACWRKADEIAADFSSLRAPYSAHGATKVSDAIRSRDTP